MTQAQAREVPLAANAPVAVEVHDLKVVLAGSGPAVPESDVVDEISFSLAAGEILGLVGESGSGKTTVGLALLGHCRRGLSIAGGSVRIAGGSGRTDSRDMLRLDEAGLRAVQGRLVCYVPQDPASALNPALSIRTQLAECLAPEAGDRNARLAALLQEVKLPAAPGFLDAYPHQLSGGQQQRIAIAMAFAARPRLIVMDEPTTGLDVTTQAHVLATVRQLCTRHGVAAVYVSHDLAVVAALAGRVAVMYAGRIVEMGPTARVLSRPDHPYTRALIRAVPDLEGRLVLQGIPGQAPDPGRRPPGCFFAPRCPLVAPACEQAAPPLVLVGPDHALRCIRPGAGERGGAGAAAPAAIADAAAAEPLLRVANLTAFHGALEILHGLTFDLPARSCLALVGESGSGKTTLARAIAGLHRQLAGSMRFQGESLAAGARHRPAEARRRIQYIFQNPYASLNPRRRIGPSIAVALDEFESLGRGEVERRVRAALDQVALPASVAERYPQQLSGGQRQRAAIARALVAEPQLLVCDEVTSSLDVSVQAVIVELLAELQRERGLAMLFVTHNLALVRSIAGRVAVMQAGRIVELGATEQVLDRPRAEETVRLLQDTPRFVQVMAG
jgi:peptide/nickel transport system ATP-binding protein